jgi:hypothetical protein
VYRIKAKPGYNVIVSDLGITFRPGGWITINKAKFDNSKVAKKVAHLLIIEEIGTIKEEKKVKDNIIQTANTNLTTRSAFEENPKDVFVAEPVGIDEMPIIEEKEEVIVPIEETKNETVEEVETEEATILDDGKEIITATEEVTTKVTEEIKPVKKPGAKKGRNKAK